MRCYGLWAAMGLAVVLGCGPGKELPPTVVEPEAPRGTDPDPLGPPPAESEPEAKAVLERAVKAITRGDPKRLEMVKASIANYTGGVHFPASPTMTDATLRLEAAWPDRAKVTFNFRGARPTITFRYIHPEGWMNQGGQEQPGKPAEVGALIYPDILAKHAVSLGLPLADPRTIAFDARKVPGATTVKIAIPDAPIFLVSFDEQSGLPIRAEYHPVELSKQRVKKVAILSDHKPQEGFLLPTTVELTHNERPAEKWTLENWGFPDQIDPAVFAAPK